MNDDRRTRVGLFVGTLALVVIGAMVAGFVIADTPPERSDATVENDYFTSEALLEASEMTPRSGEIELDARPSRTVLISTDGDPNDLEPIVDALVEHGHDVRVRGAGGSAVPITAITGTGTAQAGVSSAEDGLESELAETDALFIVGGSQLSETDHETVEEFSDAGGRVVLAADSTGTLNSDIDGLTSRFGMALGGGYLYDMHDNDANYQRVYASGANAGLADGVDEIVVDSAAPIRHDTGTAIATASGETKYSTTRQSGEFDVAVRNGNTVVIGDSDIATPLNYNRADNEQLLGNALEHLTAGPTAPYSPPEPEPPEQRPPEEPQPMPDDESAQEPLQSNEESE